ncbi:hypothetical protein ACFQH6_13180 [Halobacteriaceae archaeon GCM10025711]
MGQVHTDHRRQKIRRVHELASRQCGTDGETINDYFTADGRFLAEQYATGVYADTGAIAPISSMLAELTDLRSMLPALSVQCHACDQEELLDRSLSHLDVVEMVLVGLAAELEPGLSDDPTEHHPQGSDHQALLSDRERDILAGDADVDDAEAHRAESRVERRVTDRLEDDLSLLREHRPALYDHVRELVQEE